MSPARTGTGDGDLGRRATRGAGVTLGAQAVRFVLQIASLAVLSRLLTPRDFGLVAMVTAVVNVAEILRDFGLSSAAIQRPTLSRGERDNLFWMNLGLGATGTLLALASAPLLARLYDEPQVVGIVLALAGVFTVSGAATQYRVHLSRSLRFGALAVTDVSAQVLGIAVAVTAAVLGAGYWSIVAQQVTFVVTVFVLNAAQSGWLPGRPRRDVPMGHFTRFGANLLGTNLLGYAVNNVDNIGIGAVWGSAPLGLYTRAYQLLQVPLQQLNAPLGRVVLPVLSRVQEDREVFARYFARFQLAVAYTLGLGFGLLAGVSGPVTGLLFGPAWQGVAPILLVLAAGGVFKGVDSANYQLWVSKGLASQLFRFYLVSRPLMILVILAGLPWGPVGVAVGHLVAAALHWVVSLWWVCRLADMDYPVLFGQAARVLALVVAPAGVLARLASEAVGSDLLGLVLGILAGLAWAILVSALVPWLRRDCAPLVGMARRALVRGGGVTPG